MTNLSNNFIRWYNNVFRQDVLFQTMNTTYENSPWHRENSVGIHTDMVVSEYINGLNPDWSRDTVIGALAAAFHDVGKPAACKINGIKFKPERGKYLSFGGHELISARLWEDYAVRNWVELQETFDLVPYDIYSVGFLIEYHLPWGIKKQAKLDNIALTSMFTSQPLAYANLVLADTYGRISDDQVEKRKKVHEWVDKFLNEIVPNQITWDTEPANDVPKMVIPIGPSGCGKSTYQEKFEDFEHYSWDALRHEFYDADDYAKAYEMATADKDFMNKVNARFMDIVREGKNIYIDNVNVGKRRRTFFINEARRRGYHVQAILFPVDLITLMNRQISRPEKNVPEHAVRNQFMHLQVPQFGEFDDVIVHDGNLPKGCLLYTSPSPRDRQKSRMPSSA